MGCDMQIRDKIEAIVKSHAQFDRPVSSMIDELVELFIEIKLDVRNDPPLTEAELKEHYKRIHGEKNK